MKTFIAAVVASAFAFGTVSTFAADAAKKEELTVEQRTELRDRAARMKQQGQQTVAPAPESVKKVEKQKRSAVKSEKKVSKRSAKKVQPQA